VKNANPQPRAAKRFYETRGNIRALKNVIIKPPSVNSKTRKPLSPKAYAQGDMLTPVYWTKKIIAETRTGSGFQLFRELL